MYVICVVNQNNFVKPCFLVLTVSFDLKEILNGEAFIVWNTDSVQDF